tara:strand:- start:285 stop:434 length:150 start_codon:yes stop_codon:yes gene_type:complete
LEKNTTSYLIKGIEKEAWKKFRGKALLHGFDNAGHWLKHIIYHKVSDEK